MILPLRARELGSNRHRPAAVAAALPERLRHETRDLHDAIEANPRFKRLLAADLTRDEYRSLLARLYGHHAPAEAAISRQAHLMPAALDLPRRLCRAALCADDLNALGMPRKAIARLPRCTAEPMATIEALWGWLYVLEGSSLGGQIIVRHLAKVLGIGPATGASCISPHGSDTGAMWRSFKHLLEEASACGRLDDAAVVAGARTAFASLHHWLAAAE